MSNDEERNLLKFGFRRTSLYTVACIDSRQHIGRLLPLRIQPQLRAPMPCSIFIQKRVRLKGIPQIVEKLTNDTCQRQYLGTDIVKRALRDRRYDGIPRSVLHDVAEAFQCSFQLRLVEFKELPLLCLVVSDVSVSIRPFQEPTTRHDLLNRIIHEQKITDLDVAWWPLQHRADICDGFPLSCRRKSLCLLMRHVALKEVSIPYEVVLRRLHFGRHVPSFLKCVASRVLIPRLQADPAELVTTAAWLPTRHVHTAAVLLNGVLTLWARFCIDFDPLQVALVRLVLLLPFLNRFASHR